MTNLTIYPTFLCPFACSFCLTKNKASYNELLNLDKLVQFFKESHQYFNTINISGGEPMNLTKDYFNKLVDICQVYTKNVVVNSYPYILTNYRDDIDYHFSYDFMAKNRALEVWQNLFSFPQPFDLTVTISPLLFKYYPNQLLQKLALLKNLKSVEFIPYYKSESSVFDITKNDCLDKFNKMLLSSKLNLPYTLVNKTKLKDKIINHELKEKVEICLLPSCELAYKQFDNELIKFIKTDNSIFDKEIYLNIPENIDLYTEQLVQWSYDNVL